MRTVAWVAVGLLACACGSKDEKPADERPPGDRLAPAGADARASGDRLAPAGADAGVADAWVDVDAAPVAMGAAVDLAALPELGKAGPDGEVQIHVADAPVGMLRNVLARLGKVSVVEVHDEARVTGRIGPTTGAHAWSVATGGALGASRAIKAKGKGPTVDLDFAGAEADDVYRFLGNVQRENIVLGAAELPTLDLRAIRLPADQLLAVVTERLGLTLQRAGKVTWIHDDSTPALDRKLLARKGPAKLSLDVKDANAGEVYALLAALGALDDGAPCDRGGTATFRIKDATLGSMVAVTTALTAQEPTPGAACAGGLGDGDLRDLRLVGIATLGVKRVAGLRHVPSGTFVVVTRNASIAGATLREIGDSYVSFEMADATVDPPRTEQVSILLYPSELSPTDADASPPAFGVPSDYLGRVLTTGRLAATIIRGADVEARDALFELPDNRWYWLTGRDVARIGDAIEIQPGKVIRRDGGTTSESLLRTSR